ncbi:enterobactin exporter EntS [Raoultella terrigena]|uniref:Enterobactin exporter EntS n=1 Tax=Raoultella terrigena TaxID=577 RepID=A0A4U9DAX2_RAOTE|nr:enterobactin exporter EntS [Raoultella terrigena]
MASAVRVLYPALAEGWQMSASQIGLLYAAIPLGAALGALTSGQLAQTARPGAVMLTTTVGSFVAIALFSLMPLWQLGALCLALFGWLSAISSLLQYTLIQTQTPEAMLGRINGLWTAQNVTRRCRWRRAAGRPRRDDDPGRVGKRQRLALVIVGAM